MYSGFLVVYITTVCSPRPGTHFHKQNTLRFKNRDTRFPINSENTTKLQIQKQNKKKTLAKDKYANPKNGGTGT